MLARPPLMISTSLLLLDEDLLAVNNIEALKIRCAAHAATVDSEDAALSGRLVTLHTDDSTVVVVNNTDVVEEHSITPRRDGAAHPVFGRRINERCRKGQSRVAGILDVVELKVLGR